MIRPEVEKFKIALTGSIPLFSSALGVGFPEIFTYSFFMVLTVAWLGIVIWYWNELKGNGL